MSMNIVLIGFMGAGKSSIGRILAETLGYKYLDTDTLIEAEQGCTISDIFFYAGEEFLRKQETLTLHKLRGSKKVVLATGGGIVMAKGNMELLKEIGRVYYLNAPPELLYQRLKNSTNRPLIDGAEDKEKEILQLHTQRDPFYKQADVIVEISDNQKHQVVNIISNDIKKYSR